MSSKDIEEKAILDFKNYIWGSKVISPYIAENDKEPFWDGGVYLYKDIKDKKESFLGRIPVQLKGKLVNSFTDKKFKYNIDVVDLKAYLSNPTVFIVCQMIEGSRDSRLFYRNLLPETVKNILKGKDKQSTVAVAMKPIPESLEDFESILSVFWGDSKKQISFSGKKQFTLEDMRKRNIRNFSFVMPLHKTNPADFMGYLSTHNSFMYAQIDADLGIEVPISEEIEHISFKNVMKKDVVVGGRTFYTEYHNEITDGNLIISVENVLKLSYPMDKKGKKCTASFKVNTSMLDDCIQEAEFLLALANEGKMMLGDIEIALRVNEPNVVAECKERLEAWKQLKHVLDLMHVTKPLDLSLITEEQNKTIDILITTIGTGKSVRIGHTKSTLNMAEIGNLKLLLWESVDNDGNSFFGDFFDGRIFIEYKFEAGKKYESSPFSYLQNDSLWSRCDNIPFDKQIEQYCHLVDKNPHVYDMANLDLLAMLKAYDAMDETNEIQRKNILLYAEKLNEWLRDTETASDKKVMHFVNMCQILKRQNKLTEECIEELRKLLSDKSVDSIMKVGISLILGEKDTFDHWVASSKGVEVENMKYYPIWKFYTELN